MNLLLICLSLLCAKDTNAEIMHEGIQLCGCTETDKEYLMEQDDDELFHIDFEKQAVVKNLPDFADPIGFPDAYEFAILGQATCQHNLYTSITAYQNPPEALDIPQNSVYPRDDVELGAGNMLICHSARFFPPPVHIHWTKNGVNVTESSSLSQFYPNEDNTYNQFSHLPFTPQEGDVYTCTVEHKSLQTPDTKTWEVDVELPSVGPSVFCGAGLAVGLLGVATGTFFLVKGNKRN